MDILGIITALAADWFIDKGSEWAANQVDRLIPGTSNEGESDMAGSQVVSMTDLGIVGLQPGVPEPPAGLVAKEWRMLVDSQKYGAFTMFYWKLIDGRIVSYHSPTHTFKVWKPKKMIVLSPDPRMSQIKKLESTYRKHIQGLAKKSKALNLAKGWGGKG